MNTPLIRKRLPTDVEDCVAVLAEVHRVDGYPAVWPKDPGGFLTSMDELAAWVAVDEDRIVGHVVLTNAEVEVSELAGLDVLPAGDWAGVARLFVSPDQRGRRIAAALLATAAEAATARGRKLILSVVEDDTNPAMAVYERLGWRQIAAIAADWKRPDGRVPMMRYYLAPEPPVTTDRRAG